MKMNMISWSSLSILILVWCINHYFQSLTLEIFESKECKINFGMHVEIVTTQASALYQVLLNVLSCPCYDGWLLEFYVLTTSKVISEQVTTHIDFEVLSYWEIKPLAPWPDIPFSHIILTLSQPVLLMLRARPGSNKSINFISHWFDCTGNRTPDLPPARPALYWFGHRAWSHSRPQYVLNINKCASTPKLNKDSIWKEESWDLIARKSGGFIF